jgi:Spy/CpxP family protein refolding chaperone
MKRTVIVGIAAIACAALAGVAIAANRFAKRDPNQAYALITRKVDRLMSEINATDDQRAQINQLKDKLFKEGMDLRQNRQSLRQELFANWDAAQVDASDVHAQVDKQVDAWRAFAHDAADASIQLHDLLTPDQRAQLKQILSKRFDHAQEMHQSEQE